MTAYYNEHDPFAAAWLRELIADGLIAPGEVDERSIEDVRPDELAGFVQCHFFAGIGVWSLALRQAGWPDSAPVWTGSCPCQPFSAAGKGEGFDDERHLWPAFHWLIEQCSPELVLGEQVASSHGLAWLDLVSADLEATGYAFGAADTCAAGFGAPHIRQRLYWMADAAGSRHIGPVAGSEGEARDEARLRLPRAKRGPGLVAHADSEDQGRRGILGPGESSGTGSGSTRERPAGLRATGILAHTDDARLEGQIAERECSGERPSRQGSVDGGMEQSDRRGTGTEPRDHREAGEETPGGMRSDNGAALSLRAGANGDRPGPLNGLWRDADWLCCTDGKWRPVAPGTFPLAPAGSVRNRVGTLRGAGNAINLAQAQSFIEAVMAVRAQQFAEAA